MNLKERLQRMLQIVADAEQSGAMSALEQDIILAELREAYAELRFGTENETDAAEREQKVLAHFAEPQGGKDGKAGLKLTTENEISEQEVVAEQEPTVELPIAPIAPTEEDEDDDEPEVEVELIFNEEDDETENGELKTENEEQIEDSSEEIGDRREEIGDENLSSFDLRLSSNKRSALLSLYDDEPAPVVGEQFREAPSVADTIAYQRGVAENAPIASLRSAIGVADRYMLIRELFDGDDVAYDYAISALDAQPTFEDCLIYISEHYAWRPNNEGTKTIMSFLQRKFN